MNQPDIPVQNRDFPVFNSAERSNAGTTTRSGSILFVNDRDAFDWKQGDEQTSHCLKQDDSEMWAEWQYRWIEPRLLIEEVSRRGR